MQSLFWFSATDVKKLVLCIFKLLAFIRKVLWCIQNGIKQKGSQLKLQLEISSSALCNIANELPAKTEFEIELFLEFDN